MANTQVKQLIEENLRTQNPYLDLGNCGLRGTEPELALLAECIHLETLIFSNAWQEYGEGNIDFVRYQSQNRGNKNTFKSLKTQLPKNLKKLVLAGDYKKWEIQNYSFLQGLSHLQVLDLSFNKIQDISFLQDLNQLKSLYLSFNKIQNISFLQHFTQLQYLHLGSNQIQEISYLQPLKQLKTLFLIDNKIQDFSFLQHLSQLQVLYLGSNQIQDFSCLQHLSQLQKLVINATQIQDISFLQNLKQLQSLSLSSSQIQDFSFLQYLSQLQSLNLGKNQIQDISFLQNLKQLKSLYLIGNQIEDISFLQDLSQLNSLVLSSNKIKDISFLQNLSQLQTLILENNRIQDVSFLQGLNQLVWLDLRLNQIQDISSLQRFSQLQTLNLSENQIQDISLDFLNSLPKLVWLELFNNPILNIPNWIFDKEYADVLQEVRDYLTSVEKESRELNEAKLNIIGVGDVGKSEITDALSDLDYQFDEKRPTTPGIRIKTWVFHLEQENGSIAFRANIWDFAGQKENYNTHQFFLAKNSLNLFVWETRKGEQESKFEYWLSIVSLLSGNAPILVVQNKVDVYEGEVNQKDWKTKFPNIVDFYKTSCKTGQGIIELRKVIQNKLNELPNTKARWNHNRFKIRGILETHKEEYIELKEYLKLCTDNHLTKEQAFFLSEQLHELGIILHFSKEVLLKNTVVLKSEWAIDAAYCLINTKKVREGRFKKQDLDKIWDNERFEFKHDFLLELMKKFELIFQFQESDTYIVPDGLPIETPDEIENFRPQNTEKSLRFEYHYDFMPKGILSRLICRLHHHIKKDWFWRNGVILEYEQHTEARITLNEVSSQIKIELWGKNPEGLLLLIRSHIDYIHETLKNPPLKEMIPCYCEKCQEKNTHFFEYDYLKMCKEEGDMELRCNNRTKVFIEKLLLGILDKGRINKKFLIDLIERGDIYELYEALANAGISSHDINGLRKRYIYDGGDFQYAEQLKVWVGTYF